MRAASRLVPGTENTELADIAASCEIDRRRWLDAFRWLLQLPGIGALADRYDEARPLTVESIVSQAGLAYRPAAGRMPAPPAVLPCWRASWRRCWRKASRCAST